MCNVQDSGFIYVSTNNLTFDSWYSLSPQTMTFTALETFLDVFEKHLGMIK